MRGLNSSNGVGTCAFAVEVGVLTTGPGEKSLWFYPHVPILWKSSFLCGSGHMLISSFHIHALMLFIDHWITPEAVK